MRRQKCSDLFRGITTRLPFWEEAKVKGEWSFKRKKHLPEAAILPYGDGRDTVHALVTSHMYTHIHTHTCMCTHDIALPMPKLFATKSQT